jgi:hypothetical protein
MKLLQIVPALFVALVVAVLVSKKGMTFIP